MFSDMKTEKEVPFTDYLFPELPKTKSSSHKEENEMFLGDISRLQGNQ